MDGNPGAPAHWANKLAEPIDNTLRYVRSIEDYHRLQDHNYHPAADPVNRPKRIVTKHQDNPGYWDHDAWDYTSLGRNYVTQQLEGLSGHKRARWLDGLWKAAEGSVYPEFDEVLHVIEPFDIPDFWPSYVGWDAGYDHPTAILWFTVAPTGCIYVYDEIYQGGRSVAEHCQHVHERNAGRTVHAYYADPQHCFSHTAQSPKTIASQAKECGISMTPWPRTGGNEEMMVERVRQRLNMRGPDKQASGLKVFRTCGNTINEFQSWSYKRNVKGDMPPGEDKFEDRNNDAMDVCKGVIAMNIQHQRQVVRVVGAA